MSERCGKTAQCYDNLLKMVQNKDVSPMVLFSRNKEDDILLYTQQYVDKLNARIHDLQEENEKYKRYVNENFLYTYEELQDKVLYVQEENKLLKIHLNVMKQDGDDTQDRIDKAIEVLKLCNSKCSKEVIDILRGEE